MTSGIRNHRGLVAPLDRANVDTDAILPKQYLKALSRERFGQYLFDNERYVEPGQPLQDPDSLRPNPEFILNRPPYDTATILLARENFGCGSSREHAVWALYDYGFRVVIAPSFADIFAANAVNNGLVPARLDEDAVDELFRRAREGPLVLAVDVENATVHDHNGSRWPFHLEDRERDMLVHGIDDIDLSLEHEEDIRTFEAVQRRRAPWLYR